MRAHQLQLCTNFMDAGVQEYGGDEFKKYRAEGDAIFVGLPPPKKSTAASTSSSSSPARSSSPPADMSSYYAGSGGGCVAGDSKVTRNGRVDAIENVRVGDRVLDGNGVYREVQEVARVERGGKGLVKLGNLRITGGHPVKLAGEWVRPRDVGGAVREEGGGDEFVWTLLLAEREGASGFVADGIECLNWGHGLKGGVAEHAFFGDHARVLEELRRVGVCGDGFVAIKGASSLRRVGVGGDGFVAIKGVKRGGDGAVVGFI